MTSSIHLKTISDLYRLMGLGYTPHPMVAVVDFSKVNEAVEQGAKIITDFYSVMFKNYCKNTLKYGRKNIDFQDGSLICMAPNQVIEMDNEKEAKEDMLGWGLFFHPDFIRQTSLNEKMKNYGFFSYDVCEALHLSDKEKNILYDCILKINKELEENIDIYSRDIIASNIELLLNYCERFYGRQMITRSHSNKNIIARVEKILLDYFSDNMERAQGLPTVKYLAERVNLSPGYLSDVLRKETGKNAQELIHYHIIEEAKSNLINTEKSINEIAYFLGFEYPQYFNKLFKQKTGQTPVEFRNMN